MDFLCFTQWVTLGTNFATGGATTHSVPAGRSGRAGGVLSSIAAERMVGSGREQAHSMRQSAGTTMICVPWRHMSRDTCRRVNPYENKRWGKILEGEIAETPNLQGKCALVWNTNHVSDDPEGSKLCPQGAISFFSSMPCSSDALGPRVTKFGTQVKTNKGYSSI